MPTPGAVGNILQRIAEDRGINVVGVDIGGATSAERAEVAAFLEYYLTDGVFLVDSPEVGYVQLPGAIYAAALDLMAGGITDQPALILGCGPVGEAAARELVRRKARIILHDIDMARAGELGKRLKAPVTLEADLTTALDQAPYII